jgi:hypothetical protein
MEVVVESLDFVKNFEDVLKRNDEEQRRISSLNSVKEALEKDITILISKKEKFDKQIIEKLADCDKQIKDRQDNAERNFEAERVRLATLSERLDAQKKEQDAKEILQRQKDSEQNERDRKLTERDVEQNHREVNLDTKADKNRQDEQQIASDRMSIQKENQRIDSEWKNIGEAKKGISDVQGQIKKDQEDNRINKAKNESRAVELDSQEGNNKSEASLISAGWIKLSKAEGDVKVQRVVEDKRKKDNDDKENALKAMQVEFGFKVAKFKRENAKTNS